MSHFQMAPICPNLKVPLSFSVTVAGCKLLTKQCLRKVLHLVYQPTCADDSPLLFLSVSVKECNANFICGHRKKNSKEPKFNPTVYSFNIVISNFVLKSLYLSYSLFN